MPIIPKHRRSMNKSSVVLFGGSFDPVHLGHLFLLHCAVSMTDYRSFLLVPAKLSNFKRDSIPKASDKERLEMLRLALMDYNDIYNQDFSCNSENPDIRISTMELERGGISYTSDTVRSLKESGYGEIGLLIGDDHIGGLTGWHDFDYIRDNVEFLICRRNAQRPLWDEIPSGIRYKALEPGEVFPQSSSAVRSDVNGKLDFLSERVRDYVRANHLYV